MNPSTTVMTGGRGRTAIRRPFPCKIQHDQAKHTSGIGRSLATSEWGRRSTAPRTCKAHLLDASARWLRSTPRCMHCPPRPRPGWSRCHVAAEVHAALFISEPAGRRRARRRRCAAPIPRRFAPSGLARRRPAGLYAVRLTALGSRSTVRCTHGSRAAPHARQACSTTGATRMP